MVKNIKEFARKISCFVFIKIDNRKFLLLFILLKIFLLLFYGDKQNG